MDKSQSSPSNTSLRNMEVDDERKMYGGGEAKWFVDINARKAPAQKAKNSLDNLSGGQSQEEPAKNLEIASSLDPKESKEIFNNKGTSYKRYSLQFKQDFIDKKEKHGLTIACLLKNVSIGTASKWVDKYKTKGKENLVDRRIYNGGKPNEKLEHYVFKKFIELRIKGLPVCIKTIQNIALSAPQNVKPLDFCASPGWVQKFMN